MDRRRFLKALGLGALAAAAADSVLDPESLLWKPGAKKIFDLGAAPLPPFEVWSHWDMGVGSARAIDVGDIITIAGYYETNPPFYGGSVYYYPYRITTGDTFTGYSYPEGTDVSDNLARWEVTSVYSNCLDLSPVPVEKKKPKKAAWTPPIGKVGREDRWNRPRMRRT